MYNLIPIIGLSLLHDHGLTIDIEINHQIVNTEWGAFSNGLPLTEFDREMDAESINPGEQVSFSFLCISFFSVMLIDFSSRSAIKTFKWPYLMKTDI